jgi:hypothetical protein
MRLPDFFSAQNRAGERVQVIVEMWPGERCSLQIYTQRGEYIQTILGISRTQAEQRLYEAGYVFVP